MKTDVDLPFGIETLVMGEPDKARLATLYERFGFRTDGARKVDELTTERLVALRYRIDLAEYVVEDEGSIHS